MYSNMASISSAFLKNSEKKIFDPSKKSEKLRFLGYFYTWK
jgi:hypothetical protein